jgi:hypothetical protein
MVLHHNINTMVLHHNFNIMVLHHTICHNLALPSSPRQVNEAQDGERGGGAGLQRLRRRRHEEQHASGILHFDPILHF